MEGSINSSAETVVEEGRRQVGIERRKRRYHDEQLIGFLTSENIRLESYWISESPLGARICCTSVDGIEAAFLIEDGDLLEDCISFLKEKGAPVRRSG